jgi:hypothetical protein
VNYDGTWTAVAKPQFQPDKFGPIMANRNASFLFMPPAGVKSLTLKLSGPVPVNVTVSDLEGETVYFQTKSGGNADYYTSPLPITIPISQPGLHRIAIKSTTTDGFAVAAPIGVPFVMETFQTRSGTPSPRLYFWVPRGLKTAALYLPYAIPGRVPRLYDSEGKTIAPQVLDNGKILILPVAAGQDGKAWSIEGVVSAGNVSPQGLNIPQAWAFSPDALMVPEDALK